MHADLLLDQTSLGFEYFQTHKMKFEFDSLAGWQLVIQMLCLLEVSVVLGAERTGIVVGPGKIDTAVVAAVVVDVVAAVAGQQAPNLQWKL